MPADPVRDGLPCMLMRGGTSKGAFFLAADVPTDREVRDELMLRIMGSPDPAQIDGIGGAHPLTSKVAVVSRSAEEGIDLDYLFLQVAVDAPQVSDRQTCGNLLAGVGPFALERGLITASGDRAMVRIRLINTGDVATASFAVADGRPDYDGPAQIDGVPGTACPIDLRMAGSGPLLPTGHVADTVAGHRVTLVDNGMPVVMMDAADLGVTGAETPAELEENTALRAEVERLRRAAGPLFGLGDVTAQSVPKMFLLSSPRDGGAIATRAFIPHRVHTAIGVLMAASVAAGIRIPGAVGADLARLGDGPDTLLEHPAGVFAARVEVGQDVDGTWRAASTSLRTARKLFDGRVFARPRL